MIKVEIIPPCPVTPDVILTLSYKDAQHLLLYCNSTYARPVQGREDERRYHAVVTPIDAMYQALDAKITHP